FLRSQRFHEGGWNENPRAKEAKYAGPCDLVGRAELGGPARRIGQERLQFLICLDRNGPPSQPPQMDNSDDQLRGPPERQRQPEGRKTQAPAKIEMDGRHAAAV